MLVSLGYEVPKVLQETEEILVPGEKMEALVLLVSQSVHTLTLGSRVMYVFNRDLWDNQELMVTRVHQLVPEIQVNTEQ